MEFRAKKRGIIVGGQEIADQLFGKNLKMYRQRREDTWNPQHLGELWEQFKRMPEGSKELHGVLLTAFVEGSESLVLKPGSLLLRVSMDSGQNTALRKTVLRIKKIAGGLLEVEKVWPSVNWHYSSLVRENALYEHGESLYFMFEVTNHEQYELKNNPRYEYVAKKAKGLLTLFECYMLSACPKWPSNAFDPHFEYDEELGHANRDFKKFYFAARSIVLDKTLQGSARFDQTETFEPLMRHLVRLVLENCVHANPVLRTRAGYPVITSLLYSISQGSLPAERIEALFNPQYFAGENLQDKWSGYRWGTMTRMAQSLPAGCFEARALRKALLENLPIFQKHTQYKGLNEGSLEPYFQDHGEAA